MWNTDQLQRWSGKLGIGRPTGIDLPEQAEGLVPSKQWRDELYKEGETERPWSAGDNVQLAIGQGDLQTNPLQMAIAYAAARQRRHDRHPARRPGSRGRGRAGAEGIRPGAAPPRPDRPAPTAAVILEGLHEAAQGPGGTSYGVFGGFPIAVAGKTGTAERPPPRRPVLVHRRWRRTRTRVSSPS